MNRVSCLVQQGGASEGLRSQLERRLREHHVAHFPEQELSIRWSEAAPGFMFTAGRPSTTSAIGCVVDGPTTLDKREAYMRGVCDLWTEVTGCTDHEVLVSLSETGPAS